MLATWSAARVGPDIHAKVGGTLYSLPWRFLGDRVDARSTPSMVQFFHHGQLIKTHPRKDRGKQTDLGDYPPEKIAFHMRTPTWCRHRAAEIGPACVAVIDGLLAENALFRLRAAQGVLGLADRHDPARLEAACAVATAAGDPSYRTIKGVLAAGTETRPATRPTGDGGAAAHLHGPRSLFADPIAEVITLPVRADSGDTTPRTPHEPHRHDQHRHDQHRALRSRSPRSPSSCSSCAPCPGRAPPTPPATRRPSGPRSWPARPTCSPGSPPSTPASSHRPRPRPRRPDRRRPDMSAPGGSPGTSIPPAIVDNNALTGALRTLKLGGMLQTLDARLAQARAGELGHLEFLQVLCLDEISRRETTAIARRTRRARFEQTATLEGFDFTANPKLPAAQIRDLAALRWLHAGESVILHGPVGVGKTHIAQALAHQAIRAGAEARFAKTSRDPGRTGRRARRRHLDPPATRARPTRRARPGRLRHARAHPDPGRRPLRTDQRTRRAVADPDLQPLTRSTGIRCSPTRSSPSPCSTD